MDSVKSIQLGGAQFQAMILDWVKQSSNLYQTIFITLLILFAAYAEQIPRSIRWQLSTPIGRALLIILLYLVYVTGGWVAALIFAIGMALLWSNRPLAKMPHVTKKVEEGFQDSVHSTQVQGKRWFVERVLGENPISIEEDRVTTKAVQDDSASPNSRTSR